MAVLTGIDLLGIQAYVFASNRLRDVLAASWMVQHVTSKASLGQHGATSEQVLLSAGGNAIVEFADLGAAKIWTAHYTRWLQDTAPGLDVVIAHRDYADGDLAWAVKALQIDLARSKLERIPSTPQLGLSVTASCTVTGLPATDIDHGDLVSPGIRLLRGRNEEAKQRWQGFLSAPSDTSSWTFDFPDQLDEMGRSYGDTSTLGIVHIDGNSVGQKISAWMDYCITNEITDEDFRKQYKEWSEHIDQLGDKVLHAVVKRVHQRVEVDKKGAMLLGTPHELSFALNTQKETIFLPLRPLLLGGDDLTFLCDGRIALDLATTALDEFSKHSIPHLGEDSSDIILSACAGVALVKPHAPFHRSYQLAEDLCATAKSERRKANESNNKDTGSWMDWHMGTTKPHASIADIRTRQYERSKLNLTMRPYPLKTYRGLDVSWEWLEQKLLGPGTQPDHSFRGFRGNSHPTEESHFIANEWSGSRSRVKHIASLVPKGKDEVKNQMESWKALEQGIQFPRPLKEDGFIGNSTPLLDGIELFDLHLRLEDDPRFAQEPLTQVTDTKEEH